MQLDLNLLTALDALLEEGSVSGAAVRQHVTTPAMSRTLGRLRRVTGDEILVRSGRHMTPTPYAVAVRAETAVLVARARAVLSPRSEEDVSTLQRTFTVMAHDAAIDILAGPLLAALREEAPHLVLRILGEAGVDGPDLARGDVDLDVSANRASSPSIRTETVARFPFVVVMRAGHPLSHGRLTAAHYADGRHVVISRRGRLRDRVDDALAAQGLGRRVVASVPSTSAGFRVAATSDLLVTVPDRVSLTADLVARSLPVEISAAPINISWHRRHDDDAGHRWLREQIRLVMADGALAWVSS